MNVKRKMYCVRSKVIWHVKIKSRGRGRDRKINNKVSNIPFLDDPFIGFKNGMCGFCNSDFIFKIVDSFESIGNR